MLSTRPRRFAVWLSLLTMLAVLTPQLSAPTARADHTPAPASVTIAGSFQQELGCPTDWIPDCTTTHLDDQGNGVWRGVFNIPAGSWEYKAALNDMWAESYAGNHTNSGNTTLEQGATGDVRFYYDHKTHAVLDSVMDTTAVVAGSFQSEIGCPGDWQPDCVQSLLTDVDGDGIYVFSTTALPAGNYASKVAHNESWAENYGADGAPDGANIPFTVPTDNAEIFFVYNATTHVLTIQDGAPQGNIGLAGAHWLAPDTLAWKIEGSAAFTYTLHYSATGGLALGPDGVSGGQSIPLAYDPAGLSAELKAQFPHLAGYTALKLPQNVAAPQIKDILTGQIAVSALDGMGDLVDATGIQIPGVLDSLYAAGAQGTTLGASFAGDLPTVRVWAPTAKSVALHIFDDATTATSSTVTMTPDAGSGIWSASGDASWMNKYYLFEVEVFVPATGQVERNLVTDPYSHSLSTNSTRSQIVNLADASLMPDGWMNVAKPPLAAPEDIVIYELHMRDFSVNDPSVPENERGTYMAFTEQESNGMRHLRALAEAGLTHLHLLPVFDIATINEDKAQWQQPDPALLATYPPTSTQQADAVLATADQDAFNWGYDPYHYTTPEGSYATDPNGSARIREFREMVKSVNQNGLRVVMDVVYNHTNSSGQDEKSVLDKVVPGYYHRLNPQTGAVETSTCCQNTATEHAMMEKLMVDSLVTWAKDYKVDGFRFDLMGHHMKANMLKVRDTLQSLTMEQDGVDGSKIYIYGEGWNFGEVADNARGVNATQLDMAGTGIGTFNDRMRDAVRGGGPFDAGDDSVRNQGLINGLFYDPNALNTGSAAEQQRLLLSQDQTRVGLSGNLADFSFVGRTGIMTTGAQIDYNGSPTGYTADPQETINYIAAHDNQTLFDSIQYKAPRTATMDDKVRMQNMGNSLIALTQGVPFFHAGQDMLRSKSLDRNSYNSGDWFNKLDFTYETNNWGVGLPPPENASDVPVQTDLLGSIVPPTKAQIVRAVEHTREMLRIRKSSPLFRLQTTEAVQQQVQFLNAGPDQTPGLLVMALTETRTRHLDNPYSTVVVLFNANDAAQSFTADALKDMAMTLHPVQQASSDSVVREASYDAATGAFSVPARTTAVFVVVERQIALPLITK